MAAITFELIHKDAVTGARAGILHTPHGKFLTPLFMPVGTQATVKTLSPHEVQNLGAGVILANTYHLFLRPGAELVEKAGGLHKFMNWTRGILTDSGGFQVFSLGDLRTITEDGVKFRSHIDGSEKFLSPEISIATQAALGSDIAMAFDECIPYPADYDYAKASTERTHRWAERSLKAASNPKQGIFGIVQGGMYEDLREESSKVIGGMDFAGCAIGGLSVGEPRELMYKMLEISTRHLPENKARYLMGVGTPENIIEGVDRGIDFFDCVYPSRNGRHGHVYTNHGKLNLFNRQYEMDTRPIEEGCGCPACRSYSRAYIRHLLKAGEMLGMRLCVLHNLYFYNKMMSEIRDAIEAGNFAAYKKKKLDSMEEKE